MFGARKWAETQRAMGSVDAIILKVIGSVVEPDSILAWPQMHHARAPTSHYAESHWLLYTVPMWDCISSGVVSHLRRRRRRCRGPVAVAAARGGHHGCVARLPHLLQASAGQLLVAVVFVAA